MENCMGKFAKYFLFLYNLVFLLSGAAILGIGIWIRVDEDIDQLEELLNVTVDNYLYTAAYILIAFGSIVFVVGFLGCCGAITENKYLLGTYIFFLVVIFVGEFGGGITGVVYKDDVLGELQPNLRVTLEQYEPATTEENAIALAWDYVQVVFKCCGADNYTDYRMVNFSQPDVYVPKSCCVLVNSNPSDPQPLNMTACQDAASVTDNVTNTPSDYLWTKNCFEGVEDTLMGHTNVLIGAAIGIAFLQLLGIVLACCVYRGDKQTYKSV